MEVLFLSIVVSIVLVLVTSIVSLILYYGRSSKGNTVCLLGLSNAGKTLLYARMLQGDFVHSQTSIKENKDSLKIVNKKNKQVNIDIVDIPGNERLRERTWRQYIDTLLGVVIVLDSVNFPKEKRNVAHLLINVLSEPIIQNRHIPVLIACNKQDVALALTDEDINTQLQEEMTEILSNRSIQLDSIDQTKEMKQMKLLLNKDDNRFLFDMQATPITMISCSARGRGDEQSCEAELTLLNKWLTTIA